jgi:putative Mg2+ transporter-C (MgtC) family protein
MDYSFLLNVGVALLLGIAIGVERQLGQHPAGLRTNALVCFGAALFVSMSRHFGSDSAARVAAQIVSGIGFLGGGVILREGLSVRGLNTAATLWCSAAVGTLAGAGFLAAAAVGAAGILVTNLVLRPLVRWITPPPSKVAGEASYRVRIVCRRPDEGVIRSTVMRHVNSHPQMAVRGLATKDADAADCTVVVADIYSAEPHDPYLNELVSRLSIEPSVTAASWERVTNHA